MDLIVLEGKKSKTTSVVIGNGRTSLGRKRKSGDNRLDPKQSAAEDSHRVITDSINGNNIRREQVFHKHHHDHPSRKETENGSAHMNEVWDGETEEDPNRPLPQMMNL